MDAHPALEPREEGFIEVGWVAAKVYLNPDQPNVIALSWHAEGLDYFRQVGIVEEIRQTLAERSDPDWD